MMPSWGPNEAGVICVFALPTDKAAGHREVVRFTWVHTVSDQNT